MNILAKAISAKPNSVSNYISGKTNIPLEKLIDIANYLNCDIGWLITGKGEPGLSEDEHKSYQVVIDTKDRLISNLESSIKDKDMIIRMQQEKLERTSDNSDLVKIAEKAVEIYEQRRTAKGADESAG